MIPVVSRAQMRALDAHAVGVVRVPSIVLMENAGRGAAEVVEDKLGPRAAKGRVVVVCGVGNNGGDGFVVARRLLTRGRSVDVLLAGSANTLKGDARANHDALVGLGVPIRPVGDGAEGVRARLEGAALAVDALFGTGLDRPITGLHAECVERLNEAEVPVVAVDVPSGMNADTGETMGVAVRASCTVTFALHKLGLLTPAGAQLAGEVRVADIGVPASLVARVGHSALLLESSDVSRVLLPRKAGAHKGSAGHVAVFAGSPGKVGAALLAARSALRAGAGLVTLVTWPESHAAVQGQVPEVMTEPLDRLDLTGSVDRILQGKRSVVLGPGFGQDEDARRVTEHVLATWQGPFVVDADALSLFAGRPEVFASCRGAPVLTPHPGELGRLLSHSAGEIETDRFDAVSAAVNRARCVVLLKGAHTLVGAPEEATVVNASGNPALATAGAGDVLSGVLGAFLCGLDPFEAAWSAVHVHGRAADLWRQESHADRGLLAHEVADRIPRVLAALATAHGDCPV